MRFNEAAAAAAENPAGSWRLAGPRRGAASMRPRPRPRKTQTGRREPLSRQYSFNEAAAAAAENQYPYGSEGVKYPCGFNEAAAAAAENRGRAQDDVAGLQPELQ